MGEEVEQRRCRAESVNQRFEDRWSQCLGRAHNLLNTRTTSSENNPQMKETS